MGSHRHLIPIGLIQWRAFDTGLWNDPQYLRIYCYGCDTGGACINEALRGRIV
jgi:hypothetical protein